MHITERNAHVHIEDNFTYVFFILFNFFSRIDGIIKCSACGGVAFQNAKMMEKERSAQLSSTGFSWFGMDKKKERMEGNNTKCNCGMTKTMATMHCNAHQTNRNIEQTHWSSTQCSTPGLSDWLTDLLHGVQCSVRLALQSIQVQVQIDDQWITLHMLFYRRAIIWMREMSCKRDNELLGKKIRLKWNFCSTSERIGVFGNSSCVMAFCYREYCLMCAILINESHLVEAYRSSLLNAVWHQSQADGERKWKRGRRMHSRCWKICTILHWLMWYDNRNLAISIQKASPPILWRRWNLRVFCVKFSVDTMLWP